MKKRTLSMAFAALFIGVAVSMAGLDATPILNASFEAVGDPGNNWGYDIADWHENKEDSIRATFWEVGSTIDLVGDALLWAGSVTGGRFYQTVGTVDDSQTYSVTALIGARGGNFGTGIFSLYASTSDDATNAGDGVELSSFATLLSTINITTNNGVATGDPNVYTVSVNLLTGTGHAGEVLWLEFGSVAGTDYFDNIAVALSDPATAPGPSWVTNIIVTAKGIEGVDYSGTLANLAIDPDGDAITYARTIVGPDWLTVSAGGVLGGIPDVAGENSFTVTATDGTGTPAEATLTINVVPSAPIPTDGTAISVNFTQGQGLEQLDSETTAGLTGYVYANWNNTAGKAGTLDSLTDSDGATTGASVTWVAQGTWKDTNAETDANAGIGDAQIAWGYLDDGRPDRNPPETNINWTVTGHGYETYTVVLYLSTDADGDTYLPVVVNGVTNSVTESPKHLYTYPNWDASNTIVFTGLTGDLVVSGHRRDGGNRGSIAGFQIINSDDGPADPATVMIAGPFAGDMEISWMGENRKSYSLETNSNLISGDWETLETDLVGDGGTITVTNTMGPEQLFYRVISE